VQDLQTLIKNLMGFAQKRMGFSHPPRLFLKQDAENSKNILGKTAYYDPERESVTIFVSDRHPKDILRSIAHELVHHTQNLRGDLAPEKCGSLGPGYAQEDSHMRDMERQAYEQGNMCFRDWEDKCKKQLEEVKFLKESKKMAIKISKNELKNLIGKLLKKRKRVNEQMTSRERARMIARRNQELGLGGDGYEEEILSQVFQNAPADDERALGSSIQKFVDKQGPDGETGEARGMKTGLDLARSPRTAAGQRTGADEDAEIMRQRNQTNVELDQQRQGRAMMKDVGAALSQREEAFAMGKKWSMGKDYRGRKAPDFSKAKSRGIAYREATRNRMPIFVYKGKSFTTKFAKKAKKLDPKLPAQDRAIVDKARRSGALKALSAVEDDPAMQALYRPLPTLEEMVRKEISEQNRVSDKVSKFDAKRTKNGKVCTLQNGTQGKMFNGSCITEEAYAEASAAAGAAGAAAAAMTLDETGCGSHKKDDKKVLDEKESSCCGLTPEQGCPGSGKPHPDNLSVKIKENEEIEEGKKCPKGADCDCPACKRGETGAKDCKCTQKVDEKQFANDDSLDGDKDGKPKWADPDDPANESKVYTPEKEQELYESRFNNRNNQIFDTLKKLWIK